MSAGPTPGQLRYYRQKHRKCRTRELRASNGEWAIVHYNAAGQLTAMSDGICEVASTRRVLEAFVKPRL